jgi:predicted Zn-dependent peptidase
MQTAIELLKRDLDSEMKLGTKMVVNWDMYLEVEKQQIIDAHISGYDSSGGSAKEYYDFYYGSKGSDEYIETDVEKVTEADYIKLLEKTISTLKGASSQTEISDEEIEKEAKNHHNYYTWSAGAKWYREQLKSKI